MIGGKIKSGRAAVQRKTPREAWTEDLHAAAIARDDELEAALLEIGELQGFVDADGRVLVEDDDDPRSESARASDELRRMARKRPRLRLVKGGGDDVS